MRKRDLGILLIAAFAVFVSLQHESNFTFREAWFHTVHDSEHIGDHSLEVDHLPPPIVADLNGDGRKEVIFATPDGRIQVVEPVVGVSGESYHTARILAQVSLIPAGVKVAVEGRIAVAMAVGHLDPPSHHETTHMKGVTKKRRKAVLAVVTGGWNVLCFDHNLKLMWENSVQEHFPHFARHKEVAVTVGNQTMHKGDRGVVIVGGSMESFPQEIGEQFDEEVAEEASEEVHRRSAKETEKLEDVTGNAPGLNERHFSYYAFEGGRGTLRWKHDSKDFHRDASELSQQLVPQHDYKLDASALSTRHYGEVECRDYRHSILRSLPHSWDRRSDTRLDLASFHKHRRRHHKKLPGKTHGHHPHRSAARSVAGKDPHNVVTKAVGKVVDLAKSTKKAKKGNHSSHFWWAPNAIVAHLKEGIEIVHLYSGRTICKLLLPEGGLHADVNGDGVLDHVLASGAHGGDHFTVEVDSGTGVPFTAVKPCTAIATSGVPNREILFNGTICKDTPFAASLGVFGNDWAGGAKKVETVTPVLLPRKGAHPRGHRHRRPHGDVLFLNSEGVVTSYATESLNSKGPHGHMRWQVETRATWTPRESPSGIAEDALVPTLRAVPLKVGGDPEVILVAGESEGVILAPNGVELASITLPTNPLEPILVADFNGDRLNDLIVTTSIGTYGFVQVRQPGAYLFSSLAACVIVVVCVIFVSLHLKESKGKPRGP